MTFQGLAPEESQPGFWVRATGASPSAGTCELFEAPASHADEGAPRLEIVRDPSDPGLAQAAWRRAHAELERKVRERTAALAAANARLQVEIGHRKFLEARLLEVSDYERRRLGQDLHDGLCQHLTGLTHLWNATCRSLADAVPEQAQNLRRTVDLIQQALTQAHHLARGLSPVRPHADGLPGALRALIADFQAMYPVEVRFVCPSPLRIEDETTATHLYRIAQEALSNALKHGQCSEVTIELSADAQAHRLRIRDNGRGLSSPPAGSTGLGLETMRSRARSIGAQLEFHSSERGGLEVSVTLPHRNAPMQETL